MTEKTRKNYTAEFKRQAVRLVTEEGYKAAEAARSLGINDNMLGRYQAGTLMKKAKVEVKQNKRFRVTTDSKHNYPVAPNLLE